MTSITADDAWIRDASGQATGEVLEEIEFMNLTYFPENEAVEQMKAGEMDGYLHDDNELIVTDTGFNQTIIESVINEIQQVEASGYLLSELRDYGAQFVETIIRILNPDDTFYALISMIAFYGMFSAIDFMSTMQPHLSHGGKIFSESVQQIEIAVLQCDRGTRS